MKRVLFLCPDNAVLGPMAQAMARLYAQEGTLTYSAGLEAAEHFEPRLVHMLGELGLAPRHDAPQSLAEHADIEFDACILLGPRGMDLPVRAVHAHWTLPDPSVLDDATYRGLRDRLSERVRNLMNVLESGLD